MQFEELLNLYKEKKKPYSKIKLRKQ
jgi:hypothetical protein